MLRALIVIEVLEADTKAPTFLPHPITSRSQRFVEIPGILLAWEAAHTH